MILLMKLYAQFQPRSALEVVAVVDASRNAPVEMAARVRVPLRPKRGISTITPPRIHPGIPRTAMMSELR